jgi:acyl-CoA hydrolase
MSLMDRMSERMPQTYSKYLLVRPQDLNHAGTLFGGVMMSMADEMAFVAATLSYPGCTFVTKVFSEFNFIHGPIEGDIIQIEAEVISKGTSSVRVAVRASHAISKIKIFQTEAVLVNARAGQSIPIPEPARGAE